tara:strand:+ start:5073 stop:8429 length:3357 start_codon:yes stop_codon:yes gene_type:complete
MSGVNNRVFGTPIDGVVRAKLEARQGSDGTQYLEPGESLQGKNIAVSNYDYASRLPFVRMWTSVKVISPADVGEKGEEILVSELENPDVVPLYKFRKKVANKFGVTVDKTAVKEVKNDKGEVEKYIINYDTRDQLDFERKIYEIGNHNYLENYGEAQPNESVFEGQTYKDKNFPNESQKNPYMKPQSGITSISSETEGSLGLIKKTTVSFVVHNFYDFDNIFSKYFLAPGAQIFVDFGFADIPNLYRPQDLIKHAVEESDGVEGFLYGTPSDDETSSVGFVTKNLGDVEVLQGIVTDYSATIEPNGSVNCSVTLTSKNSALLSFATDDDMVMNIKSILTRGILYLGLRALVSSDDENDFDQDLRQLQETPNADASSSDIETYDKNLLILARKELSGKTGPAGNSIRTGIFVENLNADNTYIAWGLFEDLIINSQFGFGKNSKDIVMGKNFQVKMDSSNQFTRWTLSNKEKQHVLMSVPEDVPSFLFPEWWADFGDDNPGSYSYQINKLPAVNDEDNQTTKTYQNGEFSYKKDQVNGLERIPIREVFINVDMIVKAFESNSDVKKALQEILDELNKEGNGLFDWKMKQGKNDSEIEIIDVNYTIHSELEKTNLDENRNFIFNVQSPNSMIKDYNLDFKIPSGNIGNMYAIQGMGIGDTVFTTNPAVKKAIATNALDADALKIIYEPDMGNHRAQQMLNEPKVDSDTFNVFKQVDSLFDNNVYKISTTEVPSLIDNFEIDTALGFIPTGVNRPNLMNRDAITDDEDKQPKITADDIMKTSNETLEAAGYKIAKSFKEYYKYKISGEVEEKIPNLLPYNLSLTILGIASIQVGDTFKVDYLPNRYQKSTYLQIVKVAHEIGQGGWYTAIDTVFRIEPEKTNQHTPDSVKDKIRLSPTVVAKLPCEDQIEADAGFWSYGNDMSLANLAPYMTDIRIDYGLDWKFDYGLHFKMSKALEGELADESGEIKNSRGNFSAGFYSDAKRDEAILKYPDIKYSVRGLQSITDVVLDSTIANVLLPTTFIAKQIIDATGTYERNIYPPDFKLIPNHYYTMMVSGDKIAILYRGEVFETPVENYSDTYKFFQQYQGTNGKGIGQKLEEVEKAAEKVVDKGSNFFSGLFWD